MAFESNQPLLGHIWAQIRDPRMFFCGSISVCFDTLTLLLLEKGNKFTDFIITFSTSKESACNAEDPGLIPGSGKSSGEGNGYPLWYSCLENSMDRESCHKELNMIEWLIHNSTYWFVICYRVLEFLLSTCNVKDTTRLWNKFILE